MIVEWLQLLVFHCFHFLLIRFHSYHIVYSLLLACHACTVAQFPTCLQHLIWRWVFRMYDSGKFIQLQVTSSFVPSILTPTLPQHNFRQVVFGWQCLFLIMAHYPKKLFIWEGVSRAFLSTDKDCDGVREAHIELIKLLCPVPPHAFMSR